MESRVKMEIKIYLILVTLPLLFGLPCENETMGIYKNFTKLNVLLERNFQRVACRGIYFEIECSKIVLARMNLKSLYEGRFFRRYYNYEYLLDRSRRQKSRRMRAFLMARKHKRTMFRKLKYWRPGKVRFGCASHKGKLPRRRPILCIFQKMDYAE
ncbi:unnamed protein product [Cylicocyclus nassatus]|uniref:Uncharacterized protein n=1 Tax=Cylicocyclus nassatus TaxID=53992 RepID=A0AA36DPP1_CYLNA|nr:unnamed protein product [Cylicocyclus nassatus]